MGRFSIEKSIEAIKANPNDQNKPLEQNSNPQLPSNWPTVFPKSVIGIERNGIIVNDSNTPITSENIQVIPESLEAIKLMRLKGYNVVLFFNEPLLFTGTVSQNFVDQTNNRLMQIFGQNGILSITGLYYSSSNLKDDIYVFPNNGMLKRAEKELKVNFKTGFFITDTIEGLKAGFNSGAKPILIKNRKYEETENKINTFANRELKKNTKTYNSILNFAQELN